MPENNTSEEYKRGWDDAKKALICMLEHNAMGKPSFISWPKANENLKKYVREGALEAYFEEYQNVIKDIKL